MGRFFLQRKVDRCPMPVSGQLWQDMVEVDDLRDGQDRLANLDQPLRNSWRIVHVMPTEPAPAPEDATLDTSMEEYFIHLGHFDLVKSALHLYSDCGRLRRELDDLQGIIR